ncbi:hypothetical protein Tco_1042533 [Tanacetum coccineum]|uniref:Uncharacterized protein n=1 Tax=Tanacetum coccineum TaxID=301880 RepID=A0ABQ5GJD7_9ASTR
MSALNCLLKLSGGPAITPGKSPEKESHSSFPFPLISATCRPGNYPQPSPSTSHIRNPILSLGYSGTRLKLCVIHQERSELQGVSGPVSADSHETERPALDPWLLIAPHPDSLLLDSIIISVIWYRSLLIFIIYGYDISASYMCIIPDLLLVPALVILSLLLLIDNLISIQCCSRIQPFPLSSAAVISFTLCHALFMQCSFINNFLTYSELDQCLTGIIEYQVESIFRK